MDQSFSPPPTITIVAVDGQNERKLTLPQYMTDGAAGADVVASIEEGSVALDPGDRVLISTGIAMEIPRGFEVQLRPRSGLALKKGLTLLNTPGTIDSDFRGEVKVLMVNLGQQRQTISHGERVAQMVVAPVVRANFVFGQQLSQTARGEGGFGHTREMSKRL